MDISAHVISLADRPRRAVRVTSVRTRREDRFSIVVLSSRRTRRGRGLITSSIISWLFAVPFFLPDRRFFFPASGGRAAPPAETPKVVPRPFLSLPPPVS